MRLPDGWWRELIAQTRAPTEDTDGDGMPNGDEFAVGTDPADPGSVFRLTAWRADASGSMVLEWPSASNRVYTLWESTNLAGPFQTRATGIVAQPPANRFTNSLEGEATAVFRVSAR